jgi:hypothetical protein
MMVSIFDIQLNFIEGRRDKLQSVHYDKGPSLSWSYGSWIYNYLCNHH